MSLLLDALKKAADDKQKASQASSASPEQPGDTPSDAGSGSNTGFDHTEQQLSLQPVDEEKSKSINTEELTLDVLDAAGMAENTEGVDELKIDDVPEDETLARQQVEEQKIAEPASYTVSDEALSMLINKTNRDVKQSKRFIMLGMLLLSLIVLTSGGVYYYMDMQAEIASLERKHQIAMQSMRSKTSQEKVPEQSEIIRNLVGDSGLDDKVEYAKKQMADEKKTRQVQRGASTVASGDVETDITSTVSFKRANKVDPIAVKLDEAWVAYGEGRYGAAKKSYAEVLTIEKSNRDALLGLGAIAVVEKDNSAARNFYLSLLRLDPRDPIAIAAIASLQSDDVTLEADEAYLTDMLQKNPEAPYLNFALGNVYARQGKWKFAQAHYFNAWQHDAENADYIFNLAVSMDQLGKKQQAVNFYNDSLNKSENKKVSFSREAVRKRITELSGL